MGLVGKSWNSISCSGFMQLKSSVDCSFYIAKASFTGIVGSRALGTSGKGGA